jgi:hypothetical protein
MNAKLRQVTAAELIQNDQALTIINESGIDAQSSSAINDAFKDMFACVDEYKARANEIKITSPDQVDEIKEARATRLEIKNLRLKAEKTRKALKEKSLRTGKAIDGIANVLKYLLVPIEEHLQGQEDFIKRMKAEKRQALEASRQAELAPYEEVIGKSSGFNLADMDEAQWETLLAGAKHQHAELLAQRKREKEAAAAKARAEEEERLAKEKAAAEEREAMRLEKERLEKKLAQREAEQAAERKKAAEADALARKEKEQLAQEKRLAEEKAEAKLAAERKKAAEADALARKEKEQLAQEKRLAEEKAEAKLAAERKKAAKAQAEMERVKKAQADRREKEAETARLAKEAEEAKAAKIAQAPDKAKILTLAKDIRGIAPEVSSEGARLLLDQVNQRIENLAQWIEHRAASL